MRQMRQYAIQKKKKTFQRHNPLKGYLCRDGLLLLKDKKLWVKISEKFPEHYERKSSSLDFAEPNMTSNRFYSQIKKAANK